MVWRISYLQQYIGSKENSRKETNVGHGRSTQALHDVPNYPPALHFTAHSDTRFPRPSNAEIRIASIES